MLCPLKDGDFFLTPAYLKGGLMCPMVLLFHKIYGEDILCNILAVKFCIYFRFAAKEICMT